MTGENTPETSLRDELAAGLGAEDTALETTETSTEAPLVPAELPALEAPAMWGQSYKDSFGKIAATPDHRAVAEAWVNQWKESQGYITKRDQEFSDYRKRLDPIYEQIQPYEQYWKMQGLSPAQGITQILSYAENLARDPAGMIPQLAQMYGVDLQSLVAEQAYIDPQVAALQQRYDALEQKQRQWEQQVQQQQYNQFTDQLRAFETAKDEQGSLKHPHAARVFDHMLGLVRGGLAQNIEQAYQKAVLLDDQLQAEIVQQRAQNEATARAAEAKKALDASRNVKSKSTVDGAPPERSLREELAAQLEAAGYQ